MGCHALPPPGDLPNTGIELMSLMSPALEGGFFTSSTTWEAPYKAPTSISHSVMFNFFQPHGLQTARFLYPWILQARTAEWVAIPFFKGSF